jgi:hypothetical protein
MPQDRIRLADGSAFDVTYDWDAGHPGSRMEPPEPPQLIIEKITDLAGGETVEEEWLEKNFPQKYEELTNKLWEIISGPIDDGEDEDFEEDEDE